MYDEYDNRDIHIYFKRQSHAHTVVQSKSYITAKTQSKTIEHASTLTKESRAHIFYSKEFQNSTVSITYSTPITTS